MPILLETLAAIGPWDEGSLDDWSEGFSMSAGETLAGLLDEYEQVARRTDELVATLPDLDISHLCPKLLGSSRARAGRRAGCCST